MSDISQAGLENSILQAASNGWDFFEPPSAKEQPGRRVDASKMERLATMAAVLFDHTPEFREVMEFLADQTVRRATFVAHLGLPMDQAYGYGVFREGQNALFFTICKLIAEGRKQAAAAPRDI